MLTRLHPITLLITMSISTILVFIDQDLIYWLLLGLGFLLLLSKNRNLSWKFLLAFLAARGLLFLLRNFWGTSMHLGAIYLILFFFDRIMPVLLMAARMFLFSGSELIAVMRSLHVPEKIILSIDVFLRFFPEIMQRRKEIKEGAKIRGFSGVFQNPQAIIEKNVVPMIYKSMETADILSCSILMKGVEYPCRKTAYRRNCFGPLDGFCILLLSLCFGILIHA